MMMIVYFFSLMPNF